MTMRRLEYTVTFHTPAFLGNAEQAGQWRTPPFKALLRQWWRVAYAADHSFAVDVLKMRHDEGILFGHAWLENDHDGNGRPVAARKSLLRLRLSHWKDGGLEKSQWPADAPITHPEVKNKEGKPVPVGSALYLGFGPLVYDKQRKTTTLKANAAIQAGESATLSIAVPEEHAPRLERALWLMDRYGTLGGRSRNGWGSFSLLPLSPAEGWGEGLTQIPRRRWQEALTLDWPHAIGQDDKDVLVWQTGAFNEWKPLMKELAILKIGLRTQFVFPNTKKPPHQNVEARHWLSYPITNHTTKAWNQNARLPNSLRFKVRPDADDPKKLRGAIFHVPCLPPPEFQPQMRTIEGVWRKVHAFLDAPTQKLARIPE